MLVVTVRAPLQVAAGVSKERPPFMLISLRATKLLMCVNRVDVNVTYYSSSAIKSRITQSINTGPWTYSNGKMFSVGSLWVCGEREAYMMCLYNTVGVAGHMPSMGVLRQSFAFSNSSGSQKHSHKRGGHLRGFIGIRKRIRNRLYYFHTRIATMSGQFSPGSCVGT